ncbi:molybdenum cofactor guanylyltransferase [Maricaulis sp.]|uniref:molybdenum cofactor guanylyltransferase n=1 Tax=Maricaulis sp. TaxID=1486257 RepID=UPI002B277C06|nr:molybdenum cofactor guanylyltransferase [Maricaulis sp.]
MTRAADASGITGIVLAGGQSRRMGRDKAMLEIDGETLLDRACTLLASAGCGSIRISGRPGHPAGLPDSRPGEGPGQAIYDALELARSTDQLGILVIPVDMPGLDVGTLTPLLLPSTARCLAWTGYPLPAFITSEGAMPARSNAASVRSLLAALGTEWLAVDSGRCGDFINLNAPSDLASLGKRV